MKPVIRKPYESFSKSGMVFRDSEGVHDGMTEQHHGELCDINQIIRKYDRTGLIEHVNQAKAMYGDYTEVNEYQESLNLVIRAQSAFDELPSHIRKKFDNDPGEFFEFATNPENLDELIELGLAERLQEPSIQKVEVVNPTVEPPQNDAE